MADVFEQLEEAQQKLDKVRSLLRAHSKGEPAEKTLLNIRQAIDGDPINDEPTWAYNHH